MKLFRRKKQSISFLWQRVNPESTLVNWKEADIQSYIVNELFALLIQRPGWFDFAADMNGKRSTAYENEKCNALGQRKGETDLRIYLPGGRLLMIELKTKKGVVSKEQKQRHIDLAKLGFKICLVKAKSPAEGWRQVVALLRENGL